jgi:hypothetical protein
MQRQNVEQAEQLVAEVLVAAWRRLTKPQPMNAVSSVNCYVVPLRHSVPGGSPSMRRSGGGKSSCPVPRTEASLKST